MTFEPSAASGFAPIEASPAARFWSAVLTNGTRLEAWNLHELARHLWRSALADPVLAEMQDQLIAVAPAEEQKRFANQP